MSGDSADLSSDAREVGGALGIAVLGSITNAASRDEIDAVIDPVESRDVILRALAAADTH